MRFCIGELNYFQAIGFDTKYWRKSVDGTKAMCHAEFALTLANPEYLEIYEHNDPAFTELLQSDIWTEQEPE